MKNDYCYVSQANDNMLALFDAEYAQRMELLSDIVKAFDDKKLCWAVGCSFSLFARGIVDDFHDYDILVSNEDVQAAKDIMHEFGANLVATGGNGYCNSDDYSHWQINNCDVDVIAGFRVETFGHSFYCPISAENIEKLNMEYLSFQLPVIKLEALYVLYAMMEGWQHKRRYKRMLIEEYFTNYPPSEKLLEKYITEVTDEATRSSVAPWIAARVKEKGWV